METLTLEANERKTGLKSTLSELRVSGRIPAVIYGLHGEPVTIDVSENKFSKCLKSAKPNTVFQIEFNGKTENALIKKLAKHPVKLSKITHIDFIRVDDKTPVTVEIPIHHTGVPVGVKNEGGVFSVMKRFIKVKCLIKDIPEVFEQDISELGLNTVIYARDLKFPNGTIVTPDKTALFGITVARKVVEPTVVAAAASTEEKAAEGAEDKAEAKDGDSDKKTEKSEDSDKNKNK